MKKNAMEKVIDFFLDKLVGPVTDYAEKTPETIKGRLFKMTIGWFSIISVWVVLIIPVMVTLLLIYAITEVPYQYIRYGKKP